MARPVAFVCAFLLLISQPVVHGVSQLATAESTPVTVTATIEAIDKATRTVTLKGARGSVDVKVPDQMEGFNTLKVGDQVSATYFEALAVNVRRQGDPSVSSQPGTVTQRKEFTPGSETRRQQTFTVTITAVDPKAPSLTAKGPQGRVVTFAVKDAKQLQSVKVGDTVDVTYFESLMVKVARK
jgi:hypothetical protein